jgi:hypothetical protein
MDSAVSAKAVDQLTIREQYEPKIAPTGLEARAA